MIVAILGEPDTEATVSVAHEIGAHLKGASAMLELRLDLMQRPEPELAGVLPLPVLATCRRERDGGHFRGSESERLELLRRAAAAGAAWVDLEHDSLAEAERVRERAQVIASFHDFSGTSSNLSRTVETALRQGAAMVKIATFAKNLGDVLKLREAVQAAPGRVVAFGMGDVGLITRFLFRQMGCPWIYVRSGRRDPGDRALAPGLPALADLLDLYCGDPELPEPSGVFGVLSDRAQESIGPLVFQRLFRELGVKALYLPIQTPTLEGLLEVMEALEVRAVSVTTPFKEALLHLDVSPDDLAQRLGAANTLVRGDTGFLAFNTDYFGVREPLAALRVPPGDALVIGAGGAGRAAAGALRDLGYRVQIAGRSRARAEVVAAELGVSAGPWPQRPPAILVNATPAGGPRDPLSLPVDPGLIADGQAVFEMNYSPSETPLVRLARQRGATIVEGASMYEVQARHQLAHFGIAGADEEGQLARSVRWALDVKASC